MDKDISNRGFGNNIPNKQCWNCIFSIILQSGDNRHTWDEYTGVERHPRKRHAWLLDGSLITMRWLWDGFKNNLQCEGLWYSKLEDIFFRAIQLTSEPSNYLQHPPATFSNLQQPSGPYKYLQDPPATFSSLKVPSTYLSYLLNPSGLPATFRTIQLPSGPSS